MFKKAMMITVTIILLTAPLADAEITFFDNSNDFFQSTTIIHTDIFENPNEGFFPAEFESFIYDGEGEIGHTTWRIDNPSAFNIPISSYVLYSPAVGIDFLKLKNPYSALGFDFAAAYNSETIGNTIYIEVTEIDNNITTYEYIQNDDPNGVWKYYGFISNVGISQIKVYNDETDGILDDNFVFDNISNSAEVVSSPVYSCAGFEPPFDNITTIKGKNRCVPLKTELLDADDLPITDADISHPPIIVLVSFSSAVTPSNTTTFDGLPPAEATDGIQFVFIGGRWCYNLKVKDYYIDAGTYTFTIKSGDENEYLINSANNTVTIVVEK